jgi:putative tryptophan/tyrosine transport system substrate-binding protein
MKRRELITLLGGAAVAWPLAVRAQQPDRIRRIGVMMVNAEDDPEGQRRIRVFRQGLQQLGWSEGRNIRIDYRWRVDEADRARTSTAELITSAPDAILANGTPALAALHRATRSIPVVFVVVVDPVGGGYVESMARPGANITGFSTFEPEIGSKWLELLKEIRPGLRRVAAILDPGFRGFARVWQAIETAAPGFGLEVTNLAFRHSSDDIEAAVAALAQAPGGGLIVLPTAINNASRDRIFSLAARHRLPAVYPFRYFATGGGLMSYGFDTLDLFRRGAFYVDRILKGEKQADLPVQAPVKYELVINLKTAKSLGLDVPLHLQQRADEVIE